MVQTNYYPDIVENQPLVREDFISIYYNFVNKWLFVRWEGKRSNENIKKGADLILEYLTRTGGKKMILDSTNFQDEPPEAVEWIIKEFVPQLVDVGLEYLAWIYGENSAAFPFAEKILSRENTDIIILNFDTVRLAEVWLKSV